MSDLLGDIAAAAESVRATKPSYPDGWQPGVAWDGTHGTITGESANGSPDWSSLLRYWNFDPEQYEIIEPVQVRTWDAAVGNGEVRRMWYHRANLRRKRANSADVADLVKLVRSRRPRPAPSETLGGPTGQSAGRTAGSAYFLSLNDWQAGKLGTTATVERILAASTASVTRIKELRRAGRAIDTIVLAGIGDLVEQCDGHYPNQRFEVELDMRSQRKLVRHLILRILDDHRGLAQRIIVPCAPGNHGEARVDGKQVTGFGDNSDLEVFESVAEATSQNPAAYGHVTFLIPRDQLTLTIQPVPDGPIVAIAHGHQARRGGTTAQQKVATWIAGQAFGFRPAGDAQITVVGHFHQFAVNVNGGRTIIIAPTIDSGSQWYAETAGTDSDPGMLSFLITPTGWSDLQIL